MKFAMTSFKKNLVANFAGVGVQVFNQIFLVPLYLYYWSVELYSDWIVLTAIVSFFSISDIGFNSVTVNKFVIKYVERDYEDCRSLLINNFIMILFIFLLVFVSSLIYILNVDLVNGLGLHIINKEDANCIFMILVVQVFIGMINSIPDAVYRAVSKNHIAIYLNNTTKLLEGVLIILSLYFNFSIVIMSIIVIIPKLISLFYKMINTNKIFPIEFSLKKFDLVLLKESFTPSIAFLSFPVGNAIIFQGFSLLINKYLGAETLVVYNTTRTLCNFIKTILDTVQQAVWPEYSIAYGEKNFDRMRILHRKAFFTSTSGAVLLSIIMLLLGNYVFKVWTRDKIDFNFPLMLSFLIVLIFRNIWHTSSVTLMATNKHSVIGFMYLFSSIVSIGIGFVCVNYTHSAVYTVYCLLVVEISLSFYALNKGLRMTNDTIVGLLKEPMVIFKGYRAAFNYLLK